MLNARMGEEAGEGGDQHEEEEEGEEGEEEEEDGEDGGDDRLGAISSFVPPRFIAGRVPEFAPSPLPTCRRGGRFGAPCPFLAQAASPPQGPPGLRMWSRARDYVARALGGSAPMRARSYCDLRRSERCGCCCIC